MAGVTNTIGTRLRSFQSVLSRRYQITITLPDNPDPDTGATSVQKLEWLKADGRDFTAITPQMAAHAVGMARAVWDEAILHEQDPSPALDAVGAGVVDWITQRFGESEQMGPPDVHMHPLSRAWRERKGHASVGVYTGRLAQAFASAQVTVTSSRIAGARGGRGAGRMGRFGRIVQRLRNRASRLARKASRSASRSLSRINRGMARTVRNTRRAVRQTRSRLGRALARRFGG